MKNLNEMNKKELLEVIDNLINEKEATGRNRISIADIQVESSFEKLSRCEKIANNLIKTNKDFIIQRKNQLKADSLGYLG